MTIATRTVQIGDLDPATLDAHDAAQLAAVSGAAMAVDAPHLEPADAEHVRLYHAYGHDMRPTHALLVARDDEQIVAYAELHVSTWENPQVMFVDLEEHPDHRGRGISDVLLERAVEQARAEGRIQLIGDAWADSHRAAFWERHGYPVASRAANRRLVLADLDRDRLSDMLAEAEAASTGYELVDVGNPAPDDLVPDLLAAHMAINDAPLDDLRLEDDNWSVERLRGYEQAMTARGYRLHRLLARRTSDGSPAGQTVVCVERDRPHLGFQEDTAVVRSHRGNRLGLRLKLAMLRLLADREPGLVHIDTWNAESNRHMIAVNDAMGHVVVGRGLEVQKDLG